MRNGPVPIQAAADLAGVDVGQIRRWADAGGIEINKRGGVETVVLELVMAFSASERRRRARADRGSLRARLADARVQDQSISELQQIARDDDSG
jgi:hypothetical protein